MRHPPVLRTLLLATLLLPALAPAPSEAQGRGDCRQVRRPHVAAQVVEVTGPGGTFRFRAAYTGEHCRRGAGYLRTGLADENGRLLVPPTLPDRLVRIVPIDGTRALVDAGNRYVYDFAGGRRADALVVRPEDGSEDPAAPAGAAEAGLPVPHTVVLPLRDGGRAEFRNAWVEIAGDRLVVQTFGADGEPLSQLWSVEGEALTPVVGRIEAWRSYPGDTDASVAMLSRLFRLESADFDSTMLFLPLDRAGAPLPLPDSAIGVFPIGMGAANNRYVTLPRTRGWGIVHLRGGGVRVAVVQARLADALQRPTPAFELYTGFRPATVCEGSVCARYVAQRHGAWTFVDHVLRPVTFPGLALPTSFPDPDVALALARERQRMSPEERIRLEAEQQWAMIQRGTASVCGPRVKPGLLPREGLERHFRECVVSAYTLQQHAAAVTPEARAIAAARTEEFRTTRAAENARWQRELADARDREAAVENAWARGIEVAQRSAAVVVDAALARQYDRYWRNLRAYNSGEQNWCCGGVRPPD